MRVDGYMARCESGGGWCVVRCKEIRQEQIKASSEWWRELQTVLILCRLMMVAGERRCQAKLKFEEPLSEPSHQRGTVLVSVSFATANSVKSREIER